MALFHALTNVTIGDGSKRSFWLDPWADGISPKTIAPSIFALSKRKSWNVRDATTNDAWVLQIDMSEGLSVAHIHEFVDL